MKLVISFLILLTTLIGAYAADLPSVGVLEFRGKGVPAVEAEGISDMFCVGLVNMECFKVLDRAHIKEILEEQSFQLTGRTDELYAVEIGKLLNMDFMFTGAVLKIGSNIYITVNKISVETAEIVQSTKTNGFSYDELDVQIDYLVSFFAGNGQVAQPNRGLSNRPGQVDLQDLGVVHYTAAPRDWTVTVPSNFSKVEVAVYGSGKDETNKYGGWNAQLSVNNQLAWKSVGYDNTQGGIIMDYMLNREVYEKIGQGQYLDITSLIHAGSNTISYYHYTGGDGIGVKLKITSRQ